VNVEIPTTILVKDLDFQSIPRDTDHVRDVVSDILFVQESAAAQRSNILLSLHDDASNPDSVPFRWDFVPLFEL